MIPDLDQLADEAIHLRRDFVNVEAELERRAERLMLWAFVNPALDALAVRRETSLGLLYQGGVTPDPTCTNEAGSVRYAATQDPSVPQRYWLGRDGQRIGWAWLSTDPDTRGLYKAILTGRPECVHGDTLAAALDRIAHLPDQRPDEATRP